jgi:hypothetical protein
LCEEAKALFWAVVPAEVALLREVDISESDELMAFYGLSIPVIFGVTAAGDRRELGWPFDDVGVGEFVDSVIDGY